jgi:hypothetical protein
MSPEERLNILSEWLLCCIDGNMPYFNGSYWNELIFSTNMPNDKYDEWANDLDIWVQRVISPKKMSEHYPFDEFCRYKNKIK